MKRLALAAVLLVALGACVGAQTPEAAEPDKQLSGDEETAANTDRVQSIQTYLNALGYDAGPADGVLGKRTVAAIRAFETEQGLAPATLETRLALTSLLLQLIKAVPDISEGVTAYENGDYATALRVMKAHAALGEAVAQYNLGLMYDEGKGVPQNYAEAIEWYRKAAEQGDAYAQHNLGNMYGTGEGAPQDYVRAHMWLDLAVSRFPSGNDRDSAIRYRDLAASRMTPDQIAEAQRLAREWKPKTE